MLISNQHSPAPGDDCWMNPVSRPSEQLIRHLAEQPEQAATVAPPSRLRGCKSITHPDGSEAHFTGLDNAPDMCYRDDRNDEFIFVPQIRVHDRVRLEPGLFARIQARLKFWTDSTPAKVDH